VFEGLIVGFIEGSDEGDTLGLVEEGGWVGLVLGLTEGSSEGRDEGGLVGFIDEGLNVGLMLGLTEGPDEGDKLGFADVGAWLGLMLGFEEGSREGELVGFTVEGRWLGLDVGSLLGFIDEGWWLGLLLGFSEGDFEGMNKGDLLGLVVGFTDGEIVGLEVIQLAEPLKVEFETLGLMTACIWPLEFFRMDAVRVPSLTIRPKAELADSNKVTSESTHPICTTCIRTSIGDKLPPSCNFLTEDASYAGWDSTISPQRLDTKTYSRTPFDSWGSTPSNMDCSTTLATSTMAVEFNVLHVKFHSRVEVVSTMMAFFPALFWGVGAKVGDGVILFGVLDGRLEYTLVNAFDIEWVWCSPTNVHCRWYLHVPSLVSCHFLVWCSLAWQSLLQ
jgi:hypothetical protein